MRTEQEKFWAGDFGDKYIERNRVGIPSNLALFSRVLARTDGLQSCFEFGTNIGLNLDSLALLKPELKLGGIEINEQAAKEARSKGHDVIAGSAIEVSVLESARGKGPFDLTFTKGVLIHIAPEALDAIYEALFSLSGRYVMVCEYYNPSPVEVSYRGHQERLFKRDFAGDLMERYPLKLLDYGFQYRRDPNFPADDMTYFLMEKTG